jgi:plasmid stabilization system protein ParE
VPDAFRLKIHARAERDILAIRDFIARDKKRAAWKWMQDCERRVLSLAKLPRRYELVPEADEIGEEIRHDIFGNYRIVYRVEDDLVSILRVIHTSRILNLDSLY